MKRLAIAMLSLMLLFTVACGGEEPVDDTDAAAEVESVEEVEKVEEAAEENRITSDEVNALKEDLKVYLEGEEDNLNIYSFDYEDGTIKALIDLQNDPLPNQEEAEDILAGITWRLAELTEVDMSDHYDVDVLLITEDDGDIIHWLTERYRDGEYEMDKQEAFAILPK